MLNYPTKPPYYLITIKFKPAGVKPYETSSRKSVSFEVDHEKDKETYYQIAKDKAVKNNIISDYGLKYWERYKVDIDAPKPPDEINHIGHY